jgi:Protein of unknown function (DUF1552)
MSARIGRRALLRGAGVAIALPWLESLHARAARFAPAPPLRVAWLYVPNGAHMGAWTPPAEGPLDALPPTLAPLETHRSKLLVISGLALDKARANGDGPGDHARAAAAFLTGAQPFKTDGADLRAGVSADQVAAHALGNRTRLRSLEIGCEGGALSGQCDSGYSCAYSSTISWRTPHTPVPKETDPRLVFERLFLDGAELSAEERAERARRRKSVLDFAGEEVQALNARLGARDRGKLEEYLSCVRELERRIDATEHDGDTGIESDKRPAGKPKDYAEHLRLLSDLLVLAFRTDTTRIATFTFANEGSNRPYAFLGAPEGHHDLSHHGSEPQKLEKLGKINRFHAEQLAYLLDRLAAAGELDGALLDRTLIVYGSGIGDGNRHNHEELPILVAGGGGLAGGRHARVPAETPLANLHLALLRRFGVDVARHGDSTRPLDGLWS